VKNNYYKYILLLMVLVFISEKMYSNPGSFDSTLFVTNEILSRPTTNSITISTFPKKNMQIYFEYGTSSAYSAQSEVQNAIQNVPSRFVLNNLLPDTRYYYRMRYMETGTTVFKSGTEHTFITQRAKGSTFTFTIEADPHLYDKKGIPSMMNVTLQNQAKDNPDFVFDLGDTFGDDHYPSTITQKEMTDLHYNFLSYIGVVCHSAPFFFVLGNHEGENGYYLLQSPPNNIAVYGTLARKMYYANPIPDAFYSGNTQTEQYGIGLPENYYSWEWGDALFVVLDAYRGYTANAKPDEWDWTLGQKQYEWFRQTLMTSKAKYKFVFAHHVLGENRGGVAIAKLYEWGGYDKKGNWGFTTNRPGWELPIHQLMVKYGVNIFFQGHDHLFAQEVLDGVIYQEVPMPSDSTYTIGMLANADAFISNQIGGTGHVRVTVSPMNTKVDYIRAYLPKDTNTTMKNGEIAFSYTVAPNIIPNTDTLKFICNELLCRPTANSITINACVNKTLDVYYEYGFDSTNYLNKTSIKRCLDTIPFVFALEGLNPNTQYFYRMRYKETNAADYLSRSSHSFYTQRPKGKPFTFAIEADPHLDTNSNPDVCALTFKNILSKKPDFLFDLGDTFMTEKLPIISPSEIKKRHLLLRTYFDIACHSIPLFLVQGNHDGELGWRNDGTENNMAVWNTNLRKMFYPNPVPDQFYSGNSISENFVGLRENYYAWEWGDALFVVLDPFWYTKKKPDWGWTLGQDQYNWLKNTLSTSKAKFKFVFAHNLVGGYGNDARGGTEFADLFEMGGKNSDSTWGFLNYRSGWDKPIHSLMMENNVTIFFHGHDHFYGKQDKDGIVYQEVPQPSTRSYTSLTASEYGYKNGIFLPNRGYLLVSVSDTSVKVEYYRTYLTSEENSQKHNGDIGHSYTILKKGSVSAELLNKPIPNKFNLNQNYPNPFNPSTTIGFTAGSNNMPVLLKVYDILGREIATLVNEKKSIGSYEVCFNGSNMPSGIYYYVLKSGSDIQVKKMVYQK
jgi:phosphodiesterase/alkaline phosphatase D-like protein